MIKAVIFDLDGTLLDTLPDIHAVLNNSLQKFGIAQTDYEHTKKFIGNGAGKLIERALGNRQDLFEEVYADYLVDFANCKNNLTKLFEGEAEFLKKLGDAGILRAIVTNKPQAATDHVYARFLGNFNFNIVLGQTEYYPLKPDPASTLAIIEKFKVKKEECLFVGDGETDIKTAAAAGIKCASVLWGYRSKEELVAAGGKIFMNSFFELEKFIFNS